MLFLLILVIIIAILNQRVIATIGVGESHKPEEGEDSSSSSNTSTGGDTSGSGSGTGQANTGSQSQTSAPTPTPQQNQQQAPPDPCSSDTSAPITSADASSEKFYKSPLYVALSCIDNCGCKETYFCYNLSADGSSACEPNEKYTQPFEIPCSKNSLCNVQLSYYSIDKAGNKESVKSTILHIDNIAPETSYSGPSDKSTAYGKAEIVYGKAEIVLSCADKGSGCKETKYSLDNAQMRPYSSKIIISSQGVHTITFYSIDYAGNEESYHTISFYIASAEQKLEIRNARVSEITAYSARIFFETTISADVTLYYGTDKSSLNNSKKSSGTNHSILLEPLDPETTYYYKILATASEQRVSFEGEFTTKSEDFRIKEVSVQADVNFAIISWSTTLPAECQLSYGLSSPNENSEKVFTKIQTMYEAILKNLEPNSRYFFKIIAKRGAQTIEYNGDFFTLKSAKPSILRINVEPASRTAKEGEIFTFTATLANVENASYIWDFGDGTEEKGAIYEQKIGGLQITNTEAVMHTFYLTFEEKKEFEVKFTLYSPNSNEAIDSKSVKVTVLRAPIKIRLLEPHEAKKKNEPFEIKIELKDYFGRPITKILSYNIAIANRRIDSEIKENGIIRAYFNPNFEVRNIELASIAIDAIVDGNFVHFSTALPIKFEPLRLFAESPLKHQKFYPGNRLGLQLITFKFDKNAYKTDFYITDIRAILESINRKERIEIIPTSLGFILDMNSYKIEMQNIESGLAINLHGRDRYDNTIDEKITLNLAKKNPSFYLELKPIDGNRAYILKEKTILYKIASDKRLAGDVGIKCGNMQEVFSSVEPNNYQYYSFTLPPEYKDKKIICEFTAKAIGADAESFEMIAFDVVSSVNILLMSPNEGQSSFAEEPNKLIIDLRYADGTKASFKKLHGELLVDDIASEIEFSMIDGTYVAALPEPLKFGKHRIELKIKEPLKSEIVANVIINKMPGLSELILGILIVAIVGLLLFSSSKIVVAIKDSKAKMLAEKNNVLALLKKLKAEYFKRHLSESEFKEKYAEAEKKLKEIELRLKKKEYVYFWRKKVKQAKFL